MRMCTHAHTGCNESFSPLEAGEGGSLGRGERRGVDGPAKNRKTRVSAEAEKAKAKEKGREAAAGKRPQTRTQEIHCS